MGQICILSTQRKFRHSMDDDKDSLKDGPKHFRQIPRWNLPEIPPREQDTEEPLSMGLICVPSIWHSFQHSMNYGLDSH